LAQPIRTLKKRLQNATSKRDFKARPAWQVVFAISSLLSNLNLCNLKIFIMKLKLRQYALQLATMLISVSALISSSVSAQAAPDATLVAAAKEAGAKVTPSGLVIRMMKEGTGAQPSTSSTVKVHYKGTFPDGKEFDSSYKRGEPIEFGLNRVIPCWTEGVALMKVGGTAKLTCPSAIAYGTRGAGGVIPPNATLVFEVELLAVR
jgi:FKBP-type peptidyl-prolyl cis-trans isomerase FkpA